MAGAGAVITADGSSTGVIFGGSANVDHNGTGDGDGDGDGHARDDDHDDNESRKSSFSTRSIDADHPPLDRRELNAWCVSPSLPTPSLDARCETNPYLHVVRRPWPCIQKLLFLFGSLCSLDSLRVRTFEFYVNVPFPS